ncbi:MAG: 3-phosphoshikimate 1-carboxyvinyltransferase [Acidobacteriota bacterium]
MEWTIRPARCLHGRVQVPGDKSIAHRALLLAALAEGASELKGLPAGADVGATLAAVRRLGVEAVQTEPAGLAIKIVGGGLRGLRAPTSPLDCGNSGTTMRLLAGVLAGQPFRATLTGDRSLRRRPMHRIVEPLRAMGADVRMSSGGTAPLQIAGRLQPLRAIVHRPQVASAQVKSCVLLAGLYADGVTQVDEPLPSRDHSERLLAAMGACLAVEERGVGQLVAIQPQSRLSPLAGELPGDLSSAAYWLVAATLCPGSHLTLPQVGLNPTRTAVIDLLRSWGASIETCPGPDWYGEPTGTLGVRGTADRLRGGTIAAEQVPALIDELPVLAALGPLTEAGVEIRGAAELRVKESDRIASMAAALRCLGAEVDEFPDGLAVAASASLRGGTIRAAGDHRIALAMAAVGVAAAGPVVIEGAEAASVSYPGFGAALDRVAER